MNYELISYKEKKLYLQSYINLDVSICTLKKTIQTFTVQSKDINTDIIKREVDLEINNLNSILLKVIFEKISICRNIVYNINKMENEIEKNILILRYINGYTWDQICELMNYSLRQTYNIHKKALINFII